MASSVCTVSLIYLYHDLKPGDKSSSCGLFKVLLVQYFW